MLFRNYNQDGPTYFEVRQVNYQWRCTCNEWKLTNDCRHIRTIITEQMPMDNEIVDCPDYEQTIQASINKFHGMEVKINKSNSSPFKKEFASWA